MCACKKTLTRLGKKRQSGLNLDMYDIKKKNETNIHFAEGDANM